MQLFFFYILLSVASVLADSWIVRLSLESSDMVFVDYYNYFGIDSLASRERDVSDAVKIFPPYTNYIVAYFPHDDPARPDYWPPPNNAKYSIDIRNDQFVTEIFYFDINSTATTTRDVRVFWQEIIWVPPSYKVEFGTSTGGNAVNLFCSDAMWQSISPGIHHFRVFVQKNAYQRLEIYPDTMIMFANEQLWAMAYLVGPAGELVVPAQWSTGSEIISCENGWVTAIEPGVTSLIASFKGWSDTTTVIVLPDNIAVHFNLQLRCGWNQVSSPVIPLTQNLYSLFGGISNNIWGFDDNTFYRPFILEYGKGYFVFSDRDTIITISGIPRTDIDWDIDPGWNLIGVPNVPVLAKPILMSMSAFPYLLHWNGLYYDFEIATIPGKGYWCFSLNPAMR